MFDYDLDLRYTLYKSKKRRFEGGWRKENMEQKRMSKIAIDPDKNRLNIVMTGSISKEEMESICAGICIHTQRS
jgi:hypothetical protein